MEPKATDLDKFRTDLESVGAVLAKLAPLFPSTQELAAAVELATSGNEGQLKVLFLLVTRK